MKDFKSEEIRCGTITFSDISEAKEEGNLRSTTDNDDVEKLNHFKKYGKVPEEKEKYRYTTGIKSRTCLSPVKVKNVNGLDTF